MANAALMKRNNRLSILRAVREGDISRAELARRTGLTRAAVTMLVDELIGEGLLTEGVAVHSDKGRRPTMLSLERGARASVGIDLSREGIRLVVSDLGMNISEDIRIAPFPSREETVAETVRVIESLMRRYNVLGVGVISPGPVDVGCGRILEPTGLEKWHGFEVKELCERLGIPAFLERDTRAIAIAERGVDPKKQSFISILADHGLGGAFIWEGGIFGSREGFGCEIGHVCLDPSGEECSCGSRGCAELYASIPAVMRRARALGYPSWEELVSATDDAARRLLSDMADALSRAIVCAVNLLEPREIILSGMLSAATPILKERIEGQLSRTAFTDAGRSVTVRASALGDSARARAAAGVVIQKYFDGEII